MMKRLLTILCIPALLLLSSTEGWSLPPCEGSDDSTWTNCFGTTTYSNGNKYVGQWKYGKPHGQGTLTSPGGSKYVGEWKDGKFADEPLSKSYWTDDCKNIKRGVEQIICSDPEVILLDSQLNDAYFKIKNSISPSSFSHVKKQQAEWLKARNLKCFKQSKGDDRLKCLKKKYTERLAELAGIDIEAPDEPSDFLGAPEAGKNMHCYAEIKYAEYLKSGKDLDWLATPKQPFVALNNPCEVSDSDGLEISPEGQDIGDYVKSAKEFTWIVHERHKEAVGDEYFFYLDKLTFCKDDSDAPGGTSPHSGGTSPHCEIIIHYSANWNGNKKGTRAHNFLGEDFVFSKNDAVGFCLENSKAKICLSPLKSN